MVIVLACAAISAIVIAATLTQIVAGYPRLPAQVPMHFELDGTPSTYGPKATVFIAPALQAVFALTLLSLAPALVENDKTAHIVPGFAIECTCVIALLWRIALLVLWAANNPGKRADMKGFAFIFVPLIGLGTAALVFSLL